MRYHQLTMQTEDAGKHLLNATAQQAARSLATPAGKQLVAQVAGKILPGIGALYDVWQAYQQARDGDWRSALVSLGAAGLNAASVFTALTGPAAGVLLTADVLAQIAAILYPLRWTVLWQVAAAGDEAWNRQFDHQPDRSDPADQSLADELVKDLAKGVATFIMAELTSFVGGARSQAPADATASVALPQAQTSGQGLPLPDDEDETAPLP